ncbi:MAG TPA: pitrilysin family protein [Bacteroidales bacterium]|nr:pitrilysin family protein [Bacteroidales bacterium]
MLNRTKQPEIKTMGTFKLPEYTIEHLDNGVPVILFNAGEQDVTKVDVIFKAGSWQQDLPLTAPSAASLLNSGTKNLSSREIANKSDFFGAHLVSSATRDHASATILTLNKYTDEMTALLEEVIKNAAFPEDEIETYLRNQKHRLMVNEQKVDYLARTRFNQHIFGEHHPYGKYLRKAYFNNVTRESLSDFHRKHYHGGNAYLMASGKLPENIIQTLNRHFGQADWLMSPPPEKTFTVQSAAPGMYRVEKKDAVQSAIRIGKTFINRNHPDFKAMKVVNTLFGGYFGSRLMKNIREDKGYTYGIYSSVSSLLHEGIFSISAETGTEVTEKAVQEIFVELEKLQNEKVSAAELDTVKNYLLGNVLKMVDGAFAASDFFRSLYDAGLDQQYFYELIETIKTIDPDTIMNLSQKYLKKEDFIQVIAG